MNAATVARIAAWDFIVDTSLPAGSKVAVKDGWVTIHPRGGQPVRTGPADTPESLHSALEEAAPTASKTSTDRPSEDLPEPQKGTSK